MLCSSFGPPGRLDSALELHCRGTHSPAQRRARALKKVCSKFSGGDAGCAMADGQAQTEAHHADVKVTTAGAEPALAPPPPRPLPATAALCRAPTPPNSLAPPRPCPVAGPAFPQRPGGQDAGCGAGDRPPAALPA